MSVSRLSAPWEVGRTDDPRGSKWAGRTAGGFLWAGTTTRRRKKRDT